MSDQTLRQLARAHAKGQMDKQQYRKARAELIEGILSGDIPLRENDYPSPVRRRSLSDTFEDVTQRDNRKRRDPASDTQPLQTKRPVDQVHRPADPPPSRRKTRQTAKKWPIIAGVSVLVLIPVLIYLLVPSTPPDQDNATTVNDTAPEQPPESSSDVDNTAPEVDVSEARTLISAFLEQRSWNRQSIESFISSWQALPEQQRRAMRGSVEMGRLTNAIYKQLLAEKALSGLDNGDTAIRKQKMLVSFADRMGIDDPRIDMPEQEPDSSATGTGVEARAAEQ